MEAARAIHFLALADEARKAYRPLVLSPDEHSELEASIDDPPERCPTCDAPTDGPCPRDVDDSKGPHWLPPRRNRGHLLFGGVPVVVGSEP